MAISVDDIKACFKESSLEARELYCSDHVPCQEIVPTPIEFHRDWISRNVPCIFKGAISHWPAIKKWNVKYLEEKIGNDKVTVAVTPNGLADAVVDNKFVLPEERLMLMKEFLSYIEKPNLSKDIFYIQKQNSNMNEEFQGLLADIDKELSWASAALNKHPDAINFWMGQGRSVTSLHKDHYENLYCVVKGEKRFTLYPPSDRPFIPYKKYQVAQYKFINNNWLIEDYKAAGDENDMVPWISVDPLNPRYDLYPCFKNAKPIVCTVKPGDVLYLPSLWFHHVQQTDWTIAVNYWYDMEFDSKYIYYQTLDKISSMMEQLNT